MESKSNASTRAARSESGIYILNHDKKGKAMKAITVKYLGPTNFRGSRLRAFDSDGNSVTIPFPHNLHHDYAYREAAKELCRKMKWHGKLCEGGTKEGSVFVFVNDTDTFEI